MADQTRAPLINRSRLQAVVALTIPLGSPVPLLSQPTAAPIVPPIWSNAPVLPRPVRHTQMQGSPWATLQVVSDCGAFNVVPLNETYLNAGCEGSVIPFYNPIWPTPAAPPTRTGTQPLGSFAPLISTTVPTPPVVPSVWQRARIAPPPYVTQPQGSFTPLINIPVTPPIFPPVWQIARIAPPPYGTQPLGVPHNLHVAPMPPSRGYQRVNVTRPPQRTGTQWLGMPTSLRVSATSVTIRVFGIILD